MVFRKGRMRERMFYFSHLAKQHSFDRYEAAEDWKQAGRLEKVINLRSKLPIQSTDNQEEESE